MKSQVMVALCSNVPCRVETRHEHVLTRTLTHLIKHFTSVCSWKTKSCARLNQRSRWKSNDNDSYVSLQHFTTKCTVKKDKIKYIISNRNCLTVYRCICYRKKSLSHTVIGIPTFWKQIKPHIPARHRFPYNRPIASKSTLHRPLHENSSREVNSDRDRPNRALQYL